MNLPLGLTLMLSIEKIETNVAFLLVRSHRKPVVGLEEEQWLQGRNVNSYGLFAYAMGIDIRQ